jgi:hypothetical protein
MIPLILPYPLTSNYQVMTQKVQGITLFPYQGCAREVFLSKIRMNFWVVSPTQRTREGEEPFLYRALVWYKKEKKRDQKAKRENDDRNSTLPPTHAAPHLSFSLLRLRDESRGESRSGSRLARHPHTSTRIPNSSPAPALLVVVDAAASASSRPGAGGPVRGSGGGMDPEKRGYKFRILFFCVECLLSGLPLFLIRFSSNNCFLKQSG